MNDIDDVFRDARIAGLYDLFNPWMACDDFYLDRTTRRGGAVLDVGCGTGMLACRIAAAGIVVVGVDPAEGMLSVARSRSGAECDVVDAARHRRDYRSGRDAVPSPEGGGAQACENRAPAVHTAMRPFLEERE